MAATLSWKLQRLRTMKTVEVAHRVHRAITIAAESRGIGAATSPRATTSKLGAPWLAQIPNDLDAGLYADAGDRLLAGNWRVLALTECALGFPPRWNRDPKTRIDAPLTFGKLIDYRDERIVGDIKYVWEPARHAELVTLGQAWHLTQSPRFADAARLLVESWIEQCPYPDGPHWSSSLEAGIRLANWACAWHLLGGQHSRIFDGGSGKAFQTRWLDSIYRHSRFVSGYHSRHSSANNHLFGELAGLFVASLTWSCWRESPEWAERALKELEIEAVSQIAADGTGNEQAVWYQHYLTDLMLLVLLFGRENGAEPSARFRSRLERSLEFIGSIMDASGNVPRLGDADDGVIVRWSPDRDFCPYRSLLATGAVLFERPDFKAHARSFDDKSRWLLGAAAANTFARLPDAARSPIRRAFRAGGYYVLGDDLGSSRELKLVIDAGPLGYLGIAAHGHADALAFTLSIAGTPVLIDPGTYAMHGQGRWRDYFRGTSAHNTLRIDRVDQSESGGSFMWTRHARAWCDRFESDEQRDIFSGAHDGYMRLSDPVMHHRHVVLDKLRRSITVTEDLECTGRHDVELHWHLAPECRARVFGDLVEISCGPISLRLECPASLSAPRLAEGQEEPPLGWTSPSLDRKVPTQAIVCSATISGPASFVSRFHWDVTSESA